MKASLAGALIIGGAALLSAVWLLLLDWKRHFRPAYGGWIACLGSVLTLIAMGVLVCSDFPKVSVGFLTLATATFVASLWKLRRSRRFSE